MPQLLPKKSFQNQDVEIAYYLAEPDTDSERRGIPVLLIHGFASNAHINWYFPGWIQALTRAGYTVAAIDNRGHGQSAKLYETKAYFARVMASDSLALLDHLGWQESHVMGYSMGARLTAFLALENPSRTRSLVFGGLGMGMVTGVGAAQPIVDALLADDPNTISDDVGRRFRAFAQATKSDLRALAACMASTRQTISSELISSLKVPTMVAVGTEDDIAGSGPDLAAMIPGARYLEITGRDHQLAVGDKIYKSGVLEFWTGLEF